MGSVKSIAAVLSGCLAVYLLLLLGYLPALSNESDALPILLESLEIGSYKPLLVFLPVAMVSWQLPNLICFPNDEKSRVQLPKLGKLFVVCGGFAWVAFGVYVGVLCVIFPFAYSDTLIQLGNSPHASVYVSGQWFYFFLFHGFLLFLGAGGCSFLFLAFYQMRKHAGFSFAHSLLLFQAWSFLGTIVRFPGNLRVGNLISGWFWVSENSPLLDIGWALLMWGIVSFFSLAGFYLIRLCKKKGELTWWKMFRNPRKCIDVYSVWPWAALGSYILFMCSRLPSHISSHQGLISCFMFPELLDDPYFVMLYSLVVMSVFTDDDARSRKRKAREILMQYLRIGCRMILFLQMSTVLFLLPVIIFGKTVNQDLSLVKNLGDINACILSSDIKQAIYHILVTVGTMMLIVLHMIFYGLLVSHSRKNMRGMLIASAFVFLDFQVMNDLPSWCVWISPNTLLRTGILTTSGFLWTVGIYLILIILIMCIRHFHERRMLPCEKRCSR